MYLRAEQRYAPSSVKYQAIRDALSTEHRLELKDEEMGYETYVSGWNIGNMVPDQAYQTLVHLTGMIPSPGSPHFTVSADGEDLIARACCAYWRKANAIHRWFVENCQDGVDECQLSDPIHLEVLAGLIHSCKQVIENPELAAELLPTESGFFFGNTEYGEYYLEDLKQTIQQIDHVVKTYPKPLVLRYRSSW